MGVKISGTYKGQKRVELLHDDSGAKIITDAPKDNNGEGQSFSPTDLCAASLGSCILTTMAIKAEKSGMADLTGSYFKVEKIMVSEPRRIGTIRVELHLPSSLDARQREVLERVGNACPIHKSLHEDVQEEISYLYDVS
ncbi:MAG: OsmC family protein [Bdellovibrionales bacterium]|nr:OsmC family protein [Bdellovibrionales bacterium]